MIVCHSFFYKAHPKYLNEAVQMMRDVDNCCFFRHRDFEGWVIELRRRLRETAGGRFEKNDIRLLRTDVPGGGQVQIEVKHGMDYAARIFFVIVEKALTQRVIGGDIVELGYFIPEGILVYNEREDQL